MMFYVPVNYDRNTEMFYVQMEDEDSYMPASSWGDVWAIVRFYYGIASKPKFPELRKF